MQTGEIASNRKKICLKRTYQNSIHVRCWKTNWTVNFTGHRLSITADASPTPRKRWGKKSNTRSSFFFLRKMLMISKWKKKTVHSGYGFLSRGGCGRLDKCQSSKWELFYHPPRATWCGAFGFFPRVDVTVEGRKASLELGTELRPVKKKCNIKKELGSKGREQVKKKIRCELQLGEDCDCIDGAHATTIRTTRTRRAHFLVWSGLDRGTEK